MLPPIDPRRAGATALPSLLLGLLLGAAAAPAAAQTPGRGSESAAFTASALASAGGEAAGGSYAAEVVLGGSALLLEAEGSAYALHSGTVFVRAELDTGAPIVFGAAPGSAGAPGGDDLAVFGVGFGTDSSAVSVDVGGSAAASVTLASTTRIDATAPAGKNALDNPLGPTDLTVDVDGATAVGRGAVTYLPALVPTAPAQVGGAIALELFTGADMLAGVFWGQSVPGLGAVVPPLDGQLELLLGLKLVVPLAATTAGHRPIELPVPDNPGLAGFVVELQGLAVVLGPTPAGSFTNRIDVPLHP